MSLPLSNVVNVSLALTPKPLLIQSFGKLMFVTDETPVGVIAEYPKLYSKIDDVATDWGIDSEVYKAASAYYGNGSSEFMVMRASSEATAAKLIGGAPAQLADIQAITAGGFSIVINSTRIDVTNLDFSMAVDMADVATILSSELAGVDVTYDGMTFVLTSTIIGEGSNITYASNDIGGTAAALGLLSTSGAVMVQAIVPLSPLDALIEASDVDPSFLGISLHKKWRDTVDAEEIADYAESSQRIFFNVSNDLKSLVASDTTHIIARFKDKMLERTISMFSRRPDEYVDCAVAGRAFQVDFRGNNTTITLHLKVMKMITVEKLKQSEYDALRGHNGNAVINIVGVYVFSDSFMASGHFFDTIHGTTWLKAQIENNLFNRLYATTTKIPYTDTGIQMLRESIEQALDQGVYNGLIGSGTHPDGRYFSAGYLVNHLSTADVPYADKASRIYKGFTFEALGAGALHQAVISGNFSE